MLLPGVCYRTEFCHSRTNRTSLWRWRSPQNLDLSRPLFKVTQGHWNDTDRSATYYFQRSTSAFYSNFVARTHHFLKYSTYKYTVTLKTRVRRHSRSTGLTDTYRSTTYEYWNPINVQQQPRVYLVPFPR